MSEISEYIDFGFYDEVWNKENSRDALFWPYIWLVVYHRTTLLVCCRVIKLRGTVISISTVKYDTNIEKTTFEVKDEFNKFDAVIHTHIKCKERG